MARGSFITFWVISDVMDIISSSIDMTISIDVSAVRLVRASMFSIAAFITSASPMFFSPQAEKLAVRQMINAIAKNLLFFFMCLSSPNSFSNYVQYM